MWYNQRKADKVCDLASMQENKHVREASITWHQTQTPNMLSMGNIISTHPTMCIAYPIMHDDTNQDYELFSR